MADEIAQVVAIRHPGRVCSLSSGGDRRRDPGRPPRARRGLGHDLPPGAWPQILDAIVENAERAR